MHETLEHSARAALEHSARAKNVHLSTPRRAKATFERFQHRSHANEMAEVPEELVWELRTLFALLANMDLLLIQSLKGTRTTRTFVRDSLDISGCVHVFYPYHG